MSFSGVVCWNPEHVKDVIVADAVTPSHAVFLATHTPIHLTRQEFGGGAGTPCTEEDLLRDFLRSDVPMHLLPITGASGRGKSHLVRWLQARIPASEDQKVVYIPKYQTNLRGVIEEILRGMEGEAATSLRLQLAQAAGSIDEDTAPDRLLDALAIRVTQFGVGRPAGPITYACENLPTILRERTFREAWLAKDGVIRRFVSEAIRGRDKTDRDHPFEFTRDDLPLSIAEVGKASVDGKQFYSYLCANDELQRACVTVLNESLAPAIAEVIGLKSGDLQRIMLELRRLLLAHGRELVILIEDFAILQGVQRELLEAIVEAPTRGGERVLCNIRVAMAVTSGYFASLDTVLTRAKFHGYVYNLDVPHSDRKGMREEVLEFVGRYLNAARIGAHRLGEAYQAATADHKSESSWLPNACSGCVHRAPCHGGFGTSGDGLGLYPFNAAALDRMLRARSGDQFDPREILGGVLSHTLFGHADELRNGQFPSSRYVEKFRSDKVEPVPGSLVNSTVKDRQHGVRRQNLLVFWGGNPKEAINLPAELHQAFKLPALTGVETTSSEPPGGGSGGGGLPLEPKPGPLENRLQRLDGWRDGTYTLDQSLRLELVNFIAEAISERVPWNDFCCPKLMEDKRRFRKESVRFEAAAGEGVHKPSVHILISRSVENAEALQAIVKYMHFRHWRFEGGAAALRALAGALTRWGRDVERQYECTRTEAGRTLVKHLVSQAAFGARALGEDRSRDSIAEGFGAAFEPGPNPDSVRAERDTPWNRVHASILRGPHKGDATRRLLIERLLQTVARSQGTGAPLAIDAAACIDAVKELRRTWKPSTPESEPAWLLQYHQRVEPLIDAGVEHERERLLKQEILICANVGTATSAQEFKQCVAHTVAAVRAAGQQAREGGAWRSGQGNAERLAALYDEVLAPGVGLSPLFDLWALLRKPDVSRGELLARLAGRRGKADELLEEFVARANDFLSQSQEWVLQQEKTLERSETGLGPTIESISRDLLALSRALNEAKGETS